ncbi:MULTISPECIES: hypothetical protein [Ferrimonas]|uniref:hypothetical protein n=1 Tax=Ferrimonas TaxID=44011 RepID=UPI00041EEFA8|nr:MULTISPECIES: hypothetical protein [Ferrimonas]USD38647.1 hypothetical protein J8Z22_05945 [Ferrimonas sp. SCSIO 43195]
MTCGWRCKLNGYLMAVLATVACVSLFWAVDKHHVAAELEQQLVNQQSITEQQQQQLQTLATELTQWRELERQRQEIRRRHQQAQETGEPVALTTDDAGVTTYAQPHGGVKISREP